MDKLQTLCKAYLEGSATHQQEKLLASLLIDVGQSRTLSPEEEDCLVLLATAARRRKIHSGHTKPRTGKSSFYRKIAVAAGIALILSSGIFLFRSQPRQFTSSMTSYAIVDGEETHEREVIMNLINSQLEEAGQTMSEFEADIDKIIGDIPSFD